MMVILLKPSGQNTTGTRSNGAAFTMVTFAQYFLHDGVHHLHDVESQAIPKG